jgi:uncharacterized membrane protein
MGFIVLAFYVVFLYFWPAHARHYQQDLEAKLRELGPFLRSRMAANR